MTDHAKAVEDARKTLWAAEEAERQAELAEQLRVNDEIVAAHKANVDWATGLRLAVLDLHGPQRDDPYPPHCEVCFKSNGYEVKFPCPTYVLARDQEDS